jgi:hypothetical protein
VQPGGNPCNPPPLLVPDFEELECKLHQLAFEFGTSKVRTSPQALHDALMLGSPGCRGVLGAAALSANAKVLAQPAAAPSAGGLPTAGRTLYVATTGSDSSGTGAATAPFASLHAAAAAVRAGRAGGGPATPTTVLVRAGKYYFDRTLALGRADSHVRWAAYSGERVVLSGGRLLKSLAWKPYKGKIMVASVVPPSGAEDADVLSEQELDFGAGGAPAPPLPHDFGPPPAKWNTMHVNGVRQIRARFRACHLPPPPCGWRRPCVQCPQYCC